MCNSSSMIDTSLDVRTIFDWQYSPTSLLLSRLEVLPNFFITLFFITLKPRVERYTQSMSLEYEPASEPQHISVNELFSN